jgi:small subunit ribosomal protein S6
VRKYECMYILHPELQEEEINQVVERLQNLITEQGGVVDNVELMGKKRLAYEVKKVREGYYVLVNYHGNPEVTA